jgi:hypothetical protein
VSKVIDQTAHEYAYQTKQVGLSKSELQNSKISQLKLYESTQRKLSHYADRLIRLYKPIAKWILLNIKFDFRPRMPAPDPGKESLFGSLKKTITDSWKSFRKKPALPKPGSSTSKSGSFFSNLGPKLKNFFVKSILPAISKRSDESQVDEQHIDKLIRENFWFQEQHPGMGLKDKLIFGWKQVIRDVSFESEQTLVKRRSKLLSDLSERLIQALRRALTLF